MLLIWSPYRPLHSKGSMRPFAVNTKTRLVRIFPIKFQNHLLISLYRLASLLRNSHQTSLSNQLDGSIRNNFSVLSEIISWIRGMIFFLSLDLQTNVSCKGRLRSSQRWFLRSRNWIKELEGIVVGRSSVSFYGQIILAPEIASPYEYYI